MNNEHVIYRDGKKYRCIPDDNNGFKLVLVTDNEENERCGSSLSRHSIVSDIEEDVRSIMSGGEEHGEGRALLDPEDDDDDYDDDEDMNDDDNLDGDSSQSKNRKTSTTLASKMNRISWSPSEIDKFLDICEEKHVVQKLDGKMGQNLTHKQIFSSVAQALRNSNYSIRNKEWSHCKAKCKRLAKEYRSVQRSNNKSGNGRVSMKHFDKCHKLFFRRPSLTCVASGFESGHCHDNNNEGESTSGEQNSDDPHFQNVMEDKCNTNAASTSSSLSPLDSIPKVKPVQRRVGAGKLSSAVQVIQQWIEKDRMEAKEEREWLEKTKEAERLHDEKLMQDMATSMTGAMTSAFAAQMEMFGQLMQGFSQAQPQPVPLVMRQAPTSSTILQSQPPTPRAVPITRTPLNISNPITMTQLKSTLHPSKVIVMKKIP